MPPELLTRAVFERIWLDAYRGLPAIVWQLATGLLLNRIGTMLLPFLGLWLVGERGFQEGEAGRALAVYGCGALAGVALAGRLSDLWSARAVMLSSLVGTAVMILPLALLQEASQFGLLALIFLMGAVAEAFRPAWSTSTGRAVGGAVRRRALGLGRLATNVGQTAAAPVAGALAAAGAWGWIFGLEAATCLLAAGWLAYVTRQRSRRPGGRGGHDASELETESSAPVAKEKEGEASASPSAPARSEGGPLGSAADRWFFAGVTAVATGFFVFLFVGPLAWSMARGFDALQIGWIFAGNTALVVLCELPLVHAVREQRLDRWVQGGCLLLAAGFGLLMFPGGLGLVVLAVIVISFGEIFTGPLLFALAAERAPAAQLGRWFGALNVAFSIGHVLGPWGAALLLEAPRLGAPWTWGAAALACCFAALAFRAADSGPVAE